MILWKIGIFKIKKVILRVDFNVPIKNGIIQDDTRILKSVPTIQFLMDKGACVIILSHLGRPLKELNQDGSIDKTKFSLEPIADKLGEILNKKILFATDCAEADSLKKNSPVKFR
ncbi:MAG: phosphoglycerate kinase [Saprospiraceae bacterium]|uniref:Phosphoglycerate kinase n=1 Tax=Candidatus Defluviibacterium haderslevense TaxID=2981993 RepID=A0A9D7SF58_9BACT|nr:phosphoglycerate kinase [Candidatus Defluviibacterium haderslevense]